jgi:hypothetical protein
MQNEPDGAKEKFIDDLVAWIEGHLTSGSTATAGAEATTPASKL